MCPHCSKLLSRRDKLVNHIKTQHPGLLIPLASSTKETESAADITNLVTKVKENVLKHIPLPCPFCDKILSRRDKLNNHIKNVHVKQTEEFVKPEDEKENVVSESLLDKTNVLPKKKPQPPPCPYCKALLSRMDKLRKHIEKKHPGKKSFNPKNPSQTVKEVKREVKRETKKVTQTPWDLLWNSKEPVFVKFDFNKKPCKRQRKDSKLTVEC